MFVQTDFELAIQWAYAVQNTIWFDVECQEVPGKQYVAMQSILGQLMYIEKSSSILFSRNLYIICYL